MAAARSGGLPSFPRLEEIVEMLVDLVHVMTRDGVRLDGYVKQPDNGGASRLGVDVVILHGGAGGNFYGMGLFDMWGRQLLDQGCAVMQVNSRGHDRAGAAFEILDDCRQDFAAWTDFAEQAGFSRICHWGHSLGATKAIYALAHEHDERVAAVVAGSPPRFSYSLYSELEEGEEFLRDAARAQQFLDDEAPDAFLNVRYPIPILVTAKTFVDKYGPAERYDILRHIPNVRVPLLITIGTEEAKTMTAFKKLPPEVEKLASGLANVTFESIPRGDHAYTGEHEYVWDLIRRWLENIGR